MFITSVKCCFLIMFKNMSLLVPRSDWEVSEYCKCSCRGCGFSLFSLWHFRKRFNQKSQNKPWCLCTTFSTTGSLSGKNRIWLLTELHKNMYNKTALVIINLLMSQIGRHWSSLCLEKMETLLLTLVGDKAGSNCYLLGIHGSKDQFSDTNIMLSLV